MKKCSGKNVQIRAPMLLQTFPVVEQSQEAEDGLSLRNLLANLAYGKCVAVIGSAGKRQKRKLRDLDRK